MGGWEIGVRMNGEQKRDANKAAGKLHGIRIS
jgi:hypothetical protein